MWAAAPLKTTTPDSDPGAVRSASPVALVLTFLNNHPSLIRRQSAL